MKKQRYPTEVKERGVHPRRARYLRTISGFVAPRQIWLKKRAQDNRIILGPSAYCPVLAPTDQAVAKAGFAFLPEPRAQAPRDPVLLFSPYTPPR